MIFILINFACSLVEGTSYFLVINAKYKHHIKNFYYDILLILSIGISYGLLNDYGMAPLGTILGILVQLIWSGFVLEGKFISKCISSCSWWIILLIMSDWIVLLFADFMHISGDVPIIAALPNQPALRAYMMIISKFLLIFLQCYMFIFTNAVKKLQSLHQSLFYY